MDLQTIFIRLGLAVMLSGLIGLEREDKNRPAGFRTHILVCVGSAIVMTTSEYIFHKYQEITDIDPARLGAQVISGIGFLGAGTIIRQGMSVKGLTTAASLWAVACVGLAAGIGFYEGAIAGAAIIYFTLILLSKFGKVLQSKASHLSIFVEMENKPGKIGEIGLLLGRYDVNIRSIEFVDTETADDDSEILLRLRLKLPHGLTHERVIKEVARIQGVSRVEEI
ncbi:MAG: methyltransferase [Clostridia bacterium]|uniref:MgtC/SapB family protein n=1 Tax=Petroclostridium xylanilyticum TaxID=1792311 RepID=UPI001FA86CAE|nr:MgtC/SapB family protein [Petroclostridium xylanilyticum]MBZ4645404.1 methyltransferase [Clostridia bacterium]